MTRFWLCCLLLAPASLYAHTDTHTQTGTTVTATLSATWRDQGAALNDAGIWQVPGALMGGEAYPVEEGVSLDDASLALHHNHASGAHGDLLVGSHDNGGEAELHHAYAGFRSSRLPVTLNIEAGRMAGLFSPANSEHAGERLFSETPLALDAFFGRQLNDEGLRLQLGDADGLGAGAELWRGSSFPATPGADGGSQDLYLHFRSTRDGWQLHTGIWVLQADATSRQDTRYSSSGHSHGNSTTVATPDYEFTGATDSAGLFLRTGWQLTAAHAIFLEGEWMQVKTEGTLADATHLAPIESTHNGGWAQLAWQWQQHRLGIRHEQLALDNRLTGAGAVGLADLTGMYNADDDPARTSLIWSWQLVDSLRLRLEATEDASDPDDKRSRAGVGLIWQETLWSSK